MKEDIDSLLASIELDTLVAVEVMKQAQPANSEHPAGHIDLVTKGYWFCLPEYDKGDECGWQPFEFSKKWRHLQLIIGRLETKWFINISNDPSPWSCWLGYDTTDILVTAETPMLAVCKASIKAVRAHPETLF